MESGLLDDTIWATAGLTATNIHKTDAIKTQVFHHISSATTASAPVYIPEKSLVKRIFSVLWWHCAVAR